MNAKYDFINWIEAELGDGGSKDLAEKVFDRLRSDDRIYYTDAGGLKLRDNVSLYSVAVEILDEEWEGFPDIGVYEVYMRLSDGKERSLGKYRATLRTRRSAGRQRALRRADRFAQLQELEMNATRRKLLEKAEA